MKLRKGRSTLSYHRHPDMPLVHSMETSHCPPHGSHVLMVLLPQSLGIKFVVSLEIRRDDLDLGSTDLECILKLAEYSGTWLMHGGLKSV